MGFYGSADRALADTMKRGIAALAKADDQARDERGRWAAGATHHAEEARIHTIASKQAASIGHTSLAGRHEMAAFRHQSAADNYREALSGREGRVSVADMNARDAASVEQQYGLKATRDIAASSQQSSGTHAPTGFKIPRPS